MFNVKYEYLTNNRATNSNEMNKPERQVHAIAVFFRIAWFGNMI
jgi:hypothetical protein